MRGLAFIFLAWLVSGSAPRVQEQRAQKQTVPGRQVLLLGTPHLDDEILSSSRQRELAHVLTILERFEPAVIAVAVPHDEQQLLGESYARHVEGRLELDATGAHQLGFRLAERLGHDHVHGIDVTRSATGETLEEALKADITLGESFLRLNDPRAVRLRHAKLLERAGVSALTDGYARGFRIFDGIRRLEGEEARILVILGIDDLPVVRHCVKASSTHELVEPASLVARRAPAVPRVDAEALLRRNTRQIFHDGRLSGPGFDFLVRETVDAQFVLLGEPHNVDQVNQFTGMLFEVLHDIHGFDHLVTEQDALIMERLTRPGIRGRLDAVRAEVRRHPKALHFATDEELSLLAKVSRVSDAASPLWGVDRVHDAALALGEFLEITHATRDRRAIMTLLDEAHGHEAGGSEADLFIGSPSEAFDSLLSSLRPAKGSRAERLLHALRISREDFKAYRTEHAPGDPWGYVANERREELMKTRFVEHYDEATRPRSAAIPKAMLPKAIAKLGHWHVQRGLGPGSVPTLGDFMVDVARLGGQRAISISIQPVNVPGRHWSITDYPELAPLTTVADPEKWLLVDLRPLRGHVHAGALEVSGDVEETVFGFDLLLLLGGTDKGVRTWDESAPD